MIGAKDSSNHLVAGSLRSFPQDSWSNKIYKEKLDEVKRMIRGMGKIYCFFTYSQTLNGSINIIKKEYLIDSILNNE